MAHAPRPALRPLVHTTPGCPPLKSGLVPTVTSQATTQAPGSGEL